MSELMTIDLLREIIARVPEDFTVQIDTGKNVHQLSDKIQIDVSRKELTFKKY